VTLGPYAQLPSKFARQKDNGDAKKKNGKKKVVVHVSHDPPKARE